LNPFGRSPRAAASINVASRLARVSSRFALVTQCTASRLNEGGCASNHAHAFARALNRRSIAGSNVAVLFSFEYLPGGVGGRASNALSPAGATSPRSINA
jgi:hypothetical protein